MSSSKPHIAARICAVLALIAATFTTAACGYRPLYGQSDAATATTQELAAVAVVPIPNREGQQMRTALERRLRIKGHPETHYSLYVLLQENRQNLAEEKSGAVTRANLKLTGKFELVRDSDKAVLLSTTTHMVASFNILDSQFATLAAEQDARQRAIELLAEDIRTRLAIYFNGPRAAGGTIPQ